MYDEYKTDLFGKLQVNHVPDPHIEIGVHTVTVEVYVMCGTKEQSGKERNLDDFSASEIIRFPSGKMFLG